jgi:ribosome biogenesis protein BRX1
MAELKMTGNCLKGSRPLLSFDQSFNTEDNTHYAVLKELFVQVRDRGCNQDPFLRS